MISRKVQKMRRMSLSKNDRAMGWTGFASEAWERRRAAVRTRVAALRDAAIARRKPVTKGERGPLAAIMANIRRGMLRRARHEKYADYH